MKKVKIVTENEKKLFIINLKNCISLFREIRELKRIIEIKNRNIKILTNGDL